MKKLGKFILADYECEITQDLNDAFHFEVKKKGTRVKLRSADSEDLTDGILSICGYMRHVSHDRDTGFKWESHGV